MQNTTYPNIWDAVRAVFNGKFITLHAYIRKENRSKITDGGFHHKKIEKEEQINSKEEEK